MHFILFCKPRIAVLYTGFFCLISFKTILGQPPISLNISILKDSASTIFDQSEIIINQFISDSILCQTSDRHFQIEVKSAETQWFRVDPDAQVSGDLILETGTTQKFISLIDFFAQKPGMLEKSKTHPINIYIRLHIICTVNDVSGQHYFSNIDSISLPTSSQNDVDAIVYVKSMGASLNTFSWLQDTHDEFIDQYRYLMDTFSDSVISDIARYYVLKHEHNPILLEGTPSPSPNEKIYVREQYNLLKNSDSDFLKFKTNDFFEKYIKE